MSNILKKWQYHEKNETNKVIQKLQIKADRAKAIRDWRPAAKFMEPEDLQTMFLSSVEEKRKEQELELVFPYFFAEEDGQLKLTICYSDNYYYVRDNGCAMYQLRKHTKTEEKLQRVLKRLFKRGMLKEEMAVGCFGDKRGFLLYLQFLVFVAHAELYYTKLEGTITHYDYDEVWPKEKDNFEMQELINMLRECVRCDYDRNKGLYLRIFHRYALSSETPNFLIETFENDKIRISDGKAGEYAGEIFEMLRFRDNDISPYAKHIVRVCKNFGIDFDGQYISMTIDYADKDVVIKSMYRFMNAAIVLSEFGRLIDFPI